MNKKYLIDAELVYDEKAYDFGNAKEVEVLDDKIIGFIDENTSVYYDDIIEIFDYLKSNNLQIIKIKD